MKRLWGIVTLLTLLTIIALLLTGSLDSLMLRGVFIFCVALFLSGAVKLIGMYIAERSR